MTFDNAITKGWGSGDVYWGLCPFPGPNYLGVDRDHTTRVFLARFEARSTTQVWHGYPVNHRTGRPSDVVLKQWLADGTLPPAKISKIQARKPCSL